MLESMCWVILSFLVDTHYTDHDDQRKHEIIVKFYLKDSYSFEMRMCGTVMCRPTLAYRVHFDSINISDWTDYKILLQREIGPMLFWC